MKKRSIWLLILLLALALRLVHIQARPLWYDEAFAILYASLPISGIVAGTVTSVPGEGAVEIHPLLYNLALHGWMGLAGQSPLAARYLSVLLGMLTVSLLWRLATLCFDRRVGVVVGLLTAVNPFHVSYSQEARMYALLGLVVALVALGLLRALRDGRWWWGLYVGGAVLTLYTHNLGGFFLLALHLLVVSQRRWWPKFPPLLLADLVVSLLFSPWLVGVLPRQLGFVGRGYWLTPPGFREGLRVLMFPLLTFYEPPPGWVLGMGLFVGLLLVTLLAMRAWRTRSRAGWFLLLSWVPVLSLLILSQWWPVYLERAMLPAALFYLVSLGWLFVRGRLPRLLRWGLGLLLLAVTIGSLVGHYTYIGFPRPPFPEAVTYLQERVRPADVVVHTNKLTYFPMYVYDPDLPARFLADPPGSPQDTLAYPVQKALGIFATPTITEATGTAERVWLVYFPREMEEMGGEHPAMTWLEERFVEVGQSRFSDLVVSLYRREGP